MKKFKLILWLIIIGLMVLFIFQNQEYFEAKNTLGLNFMVVDEFRTPPLSNVVIFLSCIVIGFILSYLLTLGSRFKMRKVVKDLNNTINSDREVIASLKQELEALKGPQTEAPPEGASPEPEPEAETQKPAA